MCSQCQILASLSHNGMKDWLITVPGMLDPEMIEDTAKIVNEATKDKVKVSLIINNRAGGNALLIAEKIADRIHKERQQSLF